MKYSRDKMALPPEPFTSNRLRLRPLDKGDEPVLWQLMSDPKVVKYIGLPVETDREICRQTRLDEFAGGKRFKFFYAVEWKAPRESDAVHSMIGFVLLRPMEDGETIEIGYWILPALWGKGIATEATAAVVAHCAPLMNFPKEDISATVMIGNHASRRVLEKVGLQVTGEDIEDLPNGEIGRIWLLRWAVGS